MTRLTVVEIKRACEIYGPDQHPCCGEVDGYCQFEVEIHSPDNSCDIATQAQNTNGRKDTGYVN